MNNEQVVERLEKEIDNMEHMSFEFNKKCQEIIQRVKQLRFDIKYEDIKNG